MLENKRTHAMTAPKRIVILGIGNILLSDEGVGVRIIERLQERYEFSENISLVDGGVLGLNLLGLISEADHLVVVDAVKNQGVPGSLWRLVGEEIPRHFGAKSSLHEVGFPEILATCQALGKVPDVVILGVEPEDIETPSLEMTPDVQAGLDAIIPMVLAELDRLGSVYRERNP